MILVSPPPKDAAGAVGVGFACLFCLVFLATPPTGAAAGAGRLEVDLRPPRPRREVVVLLVLRISSRLSSILLDMLQSVEVVILGGRLAEGRARAGIRQTVRGWPRRLGLLFG